VCRQLKRACCRRGWFGIMHEVRWCAACEMLCDQECVLQAHEMGPSFLYNLGDGAVQVVGYYGTKSVSYQEALAAIFIEGWIFIIISILGIRQKLIGLLPR